MSFPPTPPTGTRWGFPEAMTKILEILKNGETLSIAKLSKRTGIDRRTVGKVLDLISEVQDSLRGREMLKEKVGKSYVIKLIRRVKDAGGKTKAIIRRK